MTLCATLFKVIEFDPVSKYLISLSV